MILNKQEYLGNNWQYTHGMKLGQFVEFFDVRSAEIYQNIHSGTRLECDLSSDKFYEKL